MNRHEMKLGQIDCAYSAFLFTLVMFIFSFGVQAQVVIGGDLEPNPGAILDLKQAQTLNNSTFGLGLPCVELSYLNLLKFGNKEITDAESGGKQYEKHIGLMVYNIANSAVADICANTDILVAGPYVWIGSEWEYLIDQETDGLAYLAFLAGFPGVNNSKVNDADDSAAGIDIPNATSTVAWHRDQEGNIFLSALFGSTRWMITNMAAKSFDKTRSDGSTAPVPNIIRAGYENKDEFLWGYPNPTATNTVNAMMPTYYKDRPQIGALYNWKAATMGISSSVEVQGICPNGWHLPTETDFVALETEILAHTSTYSSTSNLGGGAPGATSKHGAPMKNSCEKFIGSAKGTSNNVLHSARLGFEVLLVGVYDSSKTSQNPNGVDGIVDGYSSNAYFWTSTGTGTTASSRGFADNEEKVENVSSPVSNMYSVRCVKD